METLQPSLVNRELKRVFEDQYQLSKEARESILLSSNIFIHYITATANEIAKKQKKSTIQPAHIVQALEETGFASFLPDIEAYVSQMEKETKSASAES
ncbi:hypothetical protein WA556_002862 [Blastocystis sp. ATCC 50177/Nand II]